MEKKIKQEAEKLVQTRVRMEPELIARIHSVVKEDPGRPSFSQKVRELLRRALGGGSMRSLFFVALINLFLACGCGRQAVDKANLVGSWRWPGHAASEETWTFNEDGTFRYSYKDVQTGQVVDWTGTYALNGADLTRTITATHDGKPAHRNANTEPLTRAYEVYRDGSDGLIIVSFPKGEGQTAKRNYDRM